MSFDGKQFGQDVVEVIKKYVSRELAKEIGPLRKHIAKLEAELEAVRKDIHPDDGQERKVSARSARVVRLL